MFLVPLLWIFCTTKNLCLAGEVKPVTAGARVSYYNSGKFKPHVNKNNCMQDYSIHLIRFNENMKPKATANHMNIQTYNSVTEWLHSKPLQPSAGPIFSLRVPSSMIWEASSHWNHTCLICSWCFFYSARTKASDWHKCWSKLSKLTIQRVYQELVYQNEVFKTKTMLTGSTSLSPQSSKGKPWN